MSEYKKTFEEDRLIEENSYQKIYLGTNKETPSKEVLINKISKLDINKEYYNDLFECVLNSYITSGIIEDKLVLVTEYIKGDSIGLYFNFSKTTDKQRIEFVKDYLNKIISYISLDHGLFNSLINSNQIVFKDNKLYLKEYIALDNINKDINISLIIKNIGQVIQRLLSTNNKNKHGKLFNDIYRFSETLIRREKNYTTYDEMLNDFKHIYYSSIKTKNKVMNYKEHPNNMEIDYKRIRSELITGDQINPKKNRENVRYENIDLSKIDNATSLEDIIVREEEKYILINNMVIKKENDFIPNKIEEKIDDVKEVKEIKEVRNIERPIVPEPKASDQTKKISIPFNQLQEIEKEEKQEIEEEPVTIYTREPKQEEIGLPNHLKNEIASRKSENKQSKFNIWLPIIGVFAIILIFIMYLFINSDKSNTEYKQPTATFEVTIKNGTMICENLSRAYGGKIITESLWEIRRDDKLIYELPAKNTADFNASGLVPGRYSIKLTVSDSNNNFSDPFVIEKVYESDDERSLDSSVFNDKNIMANLSDEILNNLEISTSKNVKEDEEVFNSGDKSLKMDLNKEAEASISILKNIPKGSTASFKLFPNNTNSVTLYVSAYNTGDLVYQKKIKISNNSLSWNNISLQINSDIDADQILLKFAGTDNILWFDDFIVRTFK